MWTDNETAQDFLNFGSVAATVAEIIEQAKSRPISIGVSGAWGVGKSSMIKLIRSELEGGVESRRRGDSENGGDAKSKYIFVEFNAWLYQGYDDARAALIEVVASTLAKEAEERKTGVEKTKDLLERVNWFRAVKLVAGSAASMALGFPPVGLVGEAWELGKQVLTGQIDQGSLDSASEIAAKAGESTEGLIRAKKIRSPPKEIEALRKSFESVLEELNVTLVVLIDDLDRCLPETTISTLEAIRLLLFLKHTAFVIAADDHMIKHAVKRHFQGVEDDLVTNYFDKLIQFPIRVPPLGTQEVRAYMMLLFIENSELDFKAKEALRAGVCAQLGKTWQGKRVDLKFLRTLNDKLPNELIPRLDAADRLAPLMTSATGIAGNPRLIKRFLNALSIRMAMSRAQGVGVDESELAKVLLFERCGDPKAYAELIKAVTESDDGKPSILAEWERKAVAGESQDLKAPWDATFITEWLRLAPPVGDRDLRGALYVSREHAPLITPEDRLSPEAAELLEALLEHPDMAASIKDRLLTLPRPEMSVIMDRLLVRAQQEQEWGTPPILDACIVVAAADPSQGQRLAGFLIERPATQIRASVIPKIGEEIWSKGVFAVWDDEDDVSKPVKAAIKARRGNGNVAVK
jgi:predicted KAP-like P-loop ATPase